MAALTIRDDAFEIPDEDTSDDDFVAVLRERNELLVVMQMVLIRLGELNRPDEAGIRLVLLNAIDAATKGGK
jgi:hypothetical protein